MIKIRALDHFVLRVADLDRSLAFYHDLLGLPVLFLEEHRAGTRPFVSVRAGEQLLDLWPDPNVNPNIDSPEAGYFHCCFELASPLDDAIRALRTHGVQILEEEPSRRMGAQGWGDSIYCLDPDGYMVELKEERSAQ